MTHAEVVTLLRKWAREQQQLAAQLLCTPVHASMARSPEQLAAFARDALTHAHNACALITAANLFEIRRDHLGEPAGGKDTGAAVAPDALGKHR